MTEKDTFLGSKILPAGLYTRQQEASDRRKIKLRVATKSELLVTTRRSKQAIASKKLRREQTAIAIRAGDRKKKKPCDRLRSLATLVGLAIGKKLAFFLVENKHTIQLTQSIGQLDYF